TWLGGPGNRYATDWQIENDFLLTMDGAPITLRFAADITDVSQMDPMLCEGIAARLAIAICEELTQASTKIATCERQYNKFMGEARAVNGIETGSVDPPEDDYLMVRF